MNTHRQQGITAMIELTLKPISPINDWYDVKNILPLPANDSVLIRNPAELHAYKVANLNCMVVTYFELLATLPEQTQIRMLESFSEQWEKFMDEH